MANYFNQFKSAETIVNNPLSYRQLAYAHDIKGRIDAMKETNLDPETIEWLFQVVTPLNNAVAKISDQMQTVEPVLKQGDTFNYDWEGLKLIKEPNGYTDYASLVNEFVKNYTLYENFFLILSGPVNLAPVAIYHVPVCRVSSTFSADGIPDKFIVTAPKGAKSSKILEFSREDAKDGSVRYYTADKNSEFCVLDMQRVVEDDTLYEAFKPLALPCLQYLQSDMHNLNLLKNGVSAKMLMTIDLRAKAQIDSFKEQMDRNVKGSANAGNIIYMPATDKTTMQAIPDQSNKDIEYLQLKIDTRQVIYDYGGVPAALISLEASTFNNLTNARAMLFEQTILPKGNKFFNFLSKIILRRWGRGLNANDFKITYDPESLPALIRSKIEQADSLARIPMSGNFTSNEIRRMVGYEDLTEDSQAPEDQEDINAANQAVQQAQTDLADGEDATTTRE